ncbi:MAG: DUF4838 domain-containing protein [Lentisphaeria bacterium]|nr:DUF4838 domain-containing protein [Lentisphaeria bacterium]
MKKIVCGVFCALAGAGMLNAFELGKPGTPIFTDKAHEAVAAEMSGYLNRVYGGPFPVSQYVDKNKNESGIFIGIRPDGVKIEFDEKKEYCVRHVTPTQLYLFGNKNAKRLHGTQFAVYDFLEKECGVRWLWPGELGTVAEPQPPKTLKNGTEIFVPAFERRLTSSFHYGVNYLPPEIKNDLYRWMDHQKVGESLLTRGSGFQHAFGALMPREKYGKEHPEYYSLVSPERWIGDPKPDKPTRRNDWTRHGTWQLCTSNPDVRRIIAEKIAAEKSGAIRSISPNDGYGFCECPECIKQDGKRKVIGKVGTMPVYDLTNRMYNFAEDISHQVKKLNPNAKIGMFAYSIYDGVPDQKIDFPGNVYLSFCYMVAYLNKEQQDELGRKLTGLASTGARVIGREYWACHYMLDFPLSHSRKIDRNLKLLHKLNAAGIYGSPGKAFAPRATDIYILTKLTWDPTLKREDILRDFCDKGFGPKAGPVMYELFEKIEDWTEKITLNISAHMGVNYQYYRNGYAGHCRAMAECYNADFQKMCEGYLSKALKLADTPERKARIEFIRTGTRYAAVTSEALNCYSDLAAAGINMPLTQPSGNEIRMEKKNLLKLVQRAVKASEQRVIWVSRYANICAFSPEQVLGQSQLKLRPWKTLSEKAALDLTSNQFNYLVNGAFEYSGYSWDLSGKSGAELTFTQETNHDAQDNYMVKCHSGQGISLRCDLPAGASATAVNQRKICSDTPAEIAFRLFVRCGTDPRKYLQASFGDTRLEGVLMPSLGEGDSAWQELRFRPIRVPAGEYALRLEFKNPNKKKTVLHLDDLIVTVNPDIKTAAKGVEK